MGLKRVSLFVAIAVLVLLLWNHLVLSNLDAPLVDLSTYLAAARRILTGVSIYGTKYDGELANIIWGEAVDGPHRFSTFYRYPPLLAFSLLPIASWEWSSVKLLWLVTSFVATVGVAALLSGCLGEATSLKGIRWEIRFCLVLLLALLFDPVYLTCVDGQVNLVVLLFMTLFLYLTITGRDFMAGMSLALAISLKLIPVLLLIVPLRTKRWRLIAGCCACGAAWIIPSLLSPFTRGTTLSFALDFHHLVSNALESNFVANLAFDSALFVWHLGPWIPLFSTLQKVAVVCVAFAMTGREALSSPESTLLQSTRIMALLPLLSSTLFGHHLVWTLPLLVLFLCEYPRGPNFLRMFPLWRLAVFLLLSKAYLLYMVVYATAGDFGVTAVITVINLTLITLVWRTRALLTR